MSHAALFEILIVAACSPTIPLRCYSLGLTWHRAAFVGHPRAQGLSCLTSARTWVTGALIQSPFGHTRLIWSPIWFVLVGILRILMIYRNLSVILVRVRLVRVGVEPTLIIAWPKHEKSIARVGKKTTKHIKKYSHLSSSGADDQRVLLIPILIY